MIQVTRTTWVILALAALLASGSSGCGRKEGIGERTGKALDEAASEIREDVEEAGEAIKEGAEEAGEAIKKGARQAEEAIEKQTE